MKFSKSLLKDEYFGQKLFKSRLNKAQELLTDIFELDFTGNDPKIIEGHEIPKQFKYSVTFKLKERKLTAVFEFTDYLDEIFTETFKIRETAVVKVPIVSKTNDFKSVVNEILEVLEEKYDINFTALDLDEEDKNIKRIISDETDNTWLAVFTTNDHDALFRAEYVLYDKQPFLQITQFKTHIICFE